MRLIIAGHETDLKHRAVRLLSLSLIIISFFAVTFSVAYGDENASNTASDETVSLQPQDATILLVQERATEPAAPAPAKPSDEYGDVTQEEAKPAGEEVAAEIADPIEPFNRAMYHFNDKMYFWVLKPVTRGYKAVVPEEFRGLFSNFYNNLKAPIRIVNNLLQGKPGYAGKELVRLVINSTVGVGGLRDCAGECFGIKGREADFGQTLGIYGVGYGFYIVWPVLGPSSPRDTVGSVGDWLLRPQTYISSNFFDPLTIGLYVHETVNKTSFHLGDYEALKAAAIDPYIAIRDAYVQNRNDALKR
jgi:phospholipid-binding lipoprotein MlaA